MIYADTFEKVCLIVRLLRARNPDGALRRCACAQPMGKHNESSVVLPCGWTTMRARAALTKSNIGPRDRPLIILAILSIDDGTADQLTVANLCKALAIGECAWVSSRDRLIGGGWLVTSRELLANGTSRWGIKFDLRALAEFDSPTDESGDRARARCPDSSAPPSAHVIPGFPGDHEILYSPGDHAIGVLKENRHTPPPPPPLSEARGVGRPPSSREAGGRGVSCSFKEKHRDDSLQCVRPVLKPVHKSEQLWQFERYENAVGAERYRVTSIKMSKDGSKRTFILDKKNGITQGFTPQEIEQHTPEMLRLQHRGENLYFTPLSGNKHHILIDDLNREKLERLVRDGYRPAVVLESSPGSLQAIITVQKLGTPHDKEVGNRLAEHLNHAYGDPKLSGCIHPHRAPGYENRKPKHQREDGSYPYVRLLKAERRECVETLLLSRQIDAEYQRQASLRAQRQSMSEQSRPSSLKIGKAGSSTITAYRRHYPAVLALVARELCGNSEVDPSRVDSMIAVRMRVTGHTQEDIESAIFHCAPATRHNIKSRNWNDYAKRTACFAFGQSGDKQVAKLARYRQRWTNLEGSSCQSRIGSNEASSLSNHIPRATSL